MRKPKNGLLFEDSSSEYCCGLVEIGDFELQNGYYEVDGEYGEYTEKDAKDMVKSYKKEDPKDYKGSVESYITVVDGENKLDDLPDSKAISATTHSKHQRGVEVLLAKAGFKKVSSFTNPNTRSKLNVWFRKPKGQR